MSTRPNIVLASGKTAEESSVFGGSGGRCPRWGDRAGVNLRGSVWLHNEHGGYGPDHIRMLFSFSFEAAKKP